MNSLEFINNEIEELKDKLKYFTSEPHTHFVSNYITYCEEKLEMFQQIKTKLEAWGVVKEKFFIDIIERDNDYKIGFEPKTPIINGTVTRFAQLDNDKGTIIKKALEVEE